MITRIKNLRDLFPSTKTYRAFEQFADVLKERDNKMTVHHVSQFATFQAKEKVYNKANFYWYVITPLLDLGFLDKIPTWNNDLKRTQYCYVPVFNDLPRHPVGRGYYRDAWYLCKQWNDLFFGENALVKRVNQASERSAPLKENLRWVKNSEKAGRAKRVVMKAIPYANLMESKEKNALSELAGLED